MMRGIIAGVLGLSLLEAIISSQDATANTAGLIGFVSRGLARYLDPFTPLIPNIAHYGPPAPSKIPGALDPTGIIGAITGVSYSPPDVTQLPATVNAGGGPHNV